MPGLLRCDRGDYARVLHLISHARLRVHWAPGIPCALCFPGRTIDAQLGRIAPRDRGLVSFRGCLKIESEITLAPIRLAAFRHARPCAGHPRPVFAKAGKTWMAG